MARWLARLGPCSQLLYCTVLQSDKLASLGGPGGDKSAKTRDDATKLMNELVKNVSDVMAGAHTALEAMRSRCACVWVGGGWVGGWGEGQVQLTVKHTKAELFNRCAFKRNREFEL